MEYAGGGELFTRISNEGRLPENECKLYFAQIVSAVDHLVSKSCKINNCVMGGGGGDVAN